MKSLSCCWKAPQYLLLHSHPWIFLLFVRRLTQEANEIFMQISRWLDVACCLLRSRQKWESGYASYHIIVYHITWYHIISCNIVPAVALLTNCANLRRFTSVATERCRRRKLHNKTTTNAAFEQTFISHLLKQCEFPCSQSQTHPFWGSYPQQHLSFQPSLDPQLFSCPIEWL